MKRHFTSIALVIASVASSSSWTMACDGARGGGGRAIAHAVGGAVLHRGGVAHVSAAPIRSMPVARSMPQPVQMHQSAVVVQPMPSQPMYAHSEPVYAPSQPMVNYQSSQPVTNYSTAPQAPYAPANSYSQAGEYYPQSNGYQQQSNNVAPASAMPQNAMVQNSQMQQSLRPNMASPSSSMNRTTQPTSPNTSNTSMPASNSIAANNASSATGGTMSALQLLASIEQPNTNAADVPAANASVTSIPEFAPAAAAASMSGDHVGVWKVALSGSQAVELTLQADNSFRWVATKDGQENSFEGQYRMEEGRLTLVRANDLQQMVGTWAIEGGNANFRLDGTTNSALAFARQ